MSIASSGRRRSSTSIALTQQQIAGLKAIIEYERKIAEDRAKGKPAGAAPTVTRGAEGVSAAAAQAAAAHQKILDEAAEASNKYYLDEARKEQELSDAKVRAAHDAAVAEQAILDEAARATEEYDRNEQRMAEEAAAVRVQAAYSAALAEQQLRDETARLTEQFQRGEAARLAQEETARLDVLRDLFSGTTHALRTSLDGVIQGTQNVSDAFDKMAQSIVLSMSETIIERGIKAVQRRSRKC